MENSLIEGQYYKLWILLSQTRDLIFDLREKELSPYGITARQAIILFIITTLGGKTNINKIARRLHREHHTLSVGLNRMEKQGLVKKTRNPDRKYEIIVTLTEKGQQAYELSLKRESIKEIMSCLSEEEHQQLNSILKKLRDKALEDLHEVPKVPFP